MKRFLALALALLLLFVCVGCGGNDDGVVEVVKNKKLTKLNADTYLSFAHSCPGFTTKYADYDGPEERFQGGNWVWTEGVLTVTASNATGKDIEYKDCVVKVEVDAGKYGTKTVEIPLDENGNGTITYDISSENNRYGSKPDAGYIAGTAVLPATLNYRVEEASGEMKIHIKADADGNIIEENTETAE